MNIFNRKEMIVTYRFSKWFRLICSIVLFAFVCNILAEDLVQAAPVLAVENPIVMPLGTVLPASSIESLPILKAIAIDSKDPFKIDFVIDTHGQIEKADQEQLGVLIKYFLSFLTLPEKDLWVNLSPFEKDRIITPDLENTNAGRDMLLQDYILKQLAASLTYPEHELGKAFWKKIFNQARLKYGINNVPINSFNKVWVVPDKAVVYEKNGTAYIGQSRLKVLVEEDYLAMQKGKRAGATHSHAGSSDITRELIVPELEREVNEGRYFAPLRQMYNSLILAIWFKKRFKEHLINQVYVNQKKTAGITLHEKQIKEKIYAQYLKAVKKGVYNLIREDYDEASQTKVPHKYFSGGFSFANAAQVVTILPASRLGSIGHRIHGLKDWFYRFTVTLMPKGMSQMALLSILGAGIIAMGIGSNSAKAESVVASPSSQINLVQVSKRILKIGNIIPSSDQRYFSFLATYFNPTDVVTLDQQLSSNSGRLYKIDKQYFLRNWDKIFNNLSAYNWQLQTAVVAFQKKFEIAEDGQVGPITRSVLEKEMARVNGREVSVPLSRVEPSSIQKLRPVPRAAPIVASKPVVSPFPSTVKVNPPSTIEDSKPLNKNASAPAVPDLVALPPILDTARGTQMPLPSAVKRMAIEIESIATAIPVEDRLIGKIDGIVTGLDAGKAQFQAGEKIFSIIDPKLIAAKESLNAEIVQSKKRLTDLRSLFAQQAATASEISAAEHGLESLKQRLATVEQTMQASTVIAPHALTIKHFKVSNGMDVSKGAELFMYYDQQRVRLNFKVPTTVNNFNQITQLTVNGTLVQGIVSLDWSLEPLQREAQISMVVLLPSGAADARGGLKVKMSLNMEDQYPRLTSVNGQAQTLALVKNVEEFILRTPADGRVQFLVNEGDAVNAGDIVALVGHSHYHDEYRSIRLDIESLDARIRQATNGGVLFELRDAVDRLVAERTALAAKLKTVHQQLERMEIRAPQGGIVRIVSRHQSDVFRVQDELLRIGTGKVVIGNVNNTSNAVLFPKDLTIERGAPILVETPQGIRLPGRVVAVNQMPFSQDLNLPASQSVEIMINDRHGVLQLNLPVRVIVPSNDKEKQIITEILVAIEQLASQTRSAAAPPPPPEKPKVAPVYRLRVVPLTMPVVFTTTESADNWYGSLQQQVFGNSLNAGREAIDVLIRGQAEGLPNASRFSLTGSVSMTGDGKLVFGGGLKGQFQNMLGGAISTGNAIGAAIPIVFNLAGNIINLISGKDVKETALAVQMTKIAYHHWQSAIADHVHRASNLWIDISIIDQKIAQLKALGVDLQHARNVMVARESVGFSLGVTRSPVEINIQEIRAQILDLERQKDQLTINLNALRGEINTNLHKSIQVNLPWGGQFNAIDSNQEQQMLQTLLGQNSPNPQMSEAWAADGAMDMTVRLQGLKQLPSVNLAGLYINDGRGLNPLYDLMPGGIRTSSLNQGFNNALQFEIPILNQAKNIEDRIIALEKDKSRLNIEKTRAEISRELSVAAGQVRNLSGQIQQAQRLYQSAIEAWRLKANSGQFLAPDLINERMSINRAEQQLVVLKADYLKAMASLSKLGVNETPTGQARSSFQQAVFSSIGNISYRPAARLPVLTELPSPPRILSETFSRPIPAARAPTQSAYISPGVVNFAPMTPANAWILMSSASAGSLDIIKNILIFDSNIIVRRDTLNHFLSESQRNKGFLQAAKAIVLSSSYPDVSWQILHFMAERKDPDLRFVVSLVHEAMTQKNMTVMQQGLRTIGDIFTMNPEIVKRISPNDFNGYAAQDVYLTFLLTEPNNSIATQMFLDGNFWKQNDLVGIYKGLEQFVINHAGEAGIDQVKQLKELIKNTIFKKLAIDSIDDIFRSGSFKDPQFALERDLRTAIDIKSNDTANRDFLRISFHGLTEGFLHPKLVRIAQENTDILLVSNTVPVDIQLPLTQFTSAVTIAGDLDYFNSLGFAAQEAYIKSSTNKSELGRMLVANTPLRAKALDRLMEDRQGRLVAAQVYLNSIDPDLNRLIEGRSWLDTIRSDVGEVENAAANDTYRRALLKFYEQTQDEQYLNVRLATFTDIELHQVDDPRIHVRKASIDFVATDRAWKTYQLEIERRWAMFAGQRKYEGAEERILGEIKRRIDQRDDPREMDKYLRRAQASPEEKKVLDKILSMRDKFAADIAKNNQAIPYFSTEIWGGISIFGAGIAAFIGYFGNMKRNQNKKRKMDAIGLTYLLRKQLVNLDVKDMSESQRSVVSVPGNLHSPVLGSLQTWRNEISRWAQGTDELATEDLFKGLNLILNNAFEVFRLMPFTEDLIWSEGKAAMGDQYKAAFNYAYLLTVDSLNALSMVLANRNFEPTQRARLEQDLNILRGFEQYFYRYAHILENRDTIDLVMSYKFADHEWMERSGLYPLAREILLYGRMLRNSRRNIESDMPKLIAEGNSLMTGFYSDNVIKNSLKLLTETIKNGDSLARRSWSPQKRRDQKMRSFRSRAWGLVPVVLFCLNIPLAFLGLTQLFIISTIVSLVLLAIPYINFWLPNLKALAKEQDETMSLFQGRIQEKLQGILDLKGMNVPVSPEVVSDEKIVALARQEGIEEIRKEFNPNLTPHFDLIVAITENGQDKELIDSHIRSLQGKIIRKETQYDVMVSNFEGSGNGFLDIKKQVKAKFESGAYGDLRGNKSWEETRVLFVFHSKEVLDKFFLFDLGVTNGYRAAARMIKPGGNVVIYSRDAYFGPVDMLSQDGITLLTTRIARDDLKRAGWVNTDYSKNGNPRVQEILEKLDLDKLKQEDPEIPRGGKTINFMESNFNLLNNSVKKFLAFNGIMIIGPEAAQALDNIAEKTAQTQVQSKYKLHMTSDVLIPWILRITLSDPRLRDRKFKDYIIERREWPDVFDGDLEDIGADVRELNRLKLDEIEKDLRLLYDINQKMVGPQLEIKAFVPHPKAEVTVHFNGRDIPVDSSRYFVNAAQVVSESKVRSLGGLDLSQASKSIEFKEEKEFDSGHSIEASVFPSLETFKGFEFRINQYAPIENSANVFSSLLTQS